MKITIKSWTLAQMGRGTWKRGDQLDWPESECRPLLQCNPPMAYEGWHKLDKDGNIVKPKPKPKKKGA